MKAIPFIFKNKVHYFLDASYAAKDEIKESIFKRLWSPVNCTDLPAEFKKANKLPAKGWWCPKTARNDFVIARLKGVNVYHRYDLDLGYKLPTKEEYAILQADKERLKSGDLWPHQKLMKIHALVRRWCIIAGEPRTGKTRPVLEAIAEVLIQLSELGYDLNGSEFRPWFVTRNSAMRGIYKEIKKWKLYNKLNDINIMNYDRFKALYDGVTIPRIIVWDECHALRAEGTIQTNTAIDLAEQQCQRFLPEESLRIEMSGSPAPKAPDDWYTLTEIAQPGFLGPRIKSVFSAELGDWEENDNGQKYYKTLIGWKEDKVKELAGRLAGLVLPILKKDVMAYLPDIMFEPIYCKPTKEQEETLKFLKTQPDFNKGLALRRTLREIADGFIYSHKVVKDEEGNIVYTASGQAKKEKVTTYIPCGKDPALKEILDNESDHAITSEKGARIVIYCGFEATVDKVTEICVQKGWAVYQIDGRGQKAYGTSHSVETLNNEMDRSSDQGIVAKIAVVAQQDAAGTGMEFSSSSIQVGYSNGERADSWLQAKDRGHSANMDLNRGLTWININCMPIDELMLESLRNKQDIQHISLGDLQKAANVKTWAEQDIEMDFDSPDNFEVGII